MATAGDDIQHTLAMLTGGAEINNIVSIYSNVYALCAQHIDSDYIGGSPEVDSPEERFIK